MSKIAVVSDVNAGLDYLGYDPGILRFCDQSLILGKSIMSTALISKPINFKKN